VRLDNRFGDWQTHPGAFHAITLVAAPIKFLKDQILFGIIDAGSAIGYAGDDEIAILVGRDGNRLVRWLILICIFDQVHQRFANSREVHAHSRQLGRNAKVDTPVSERGLRLGECG
jgi:hypothetical protein